MTLPKPKMLPRVKVILSEEEYLKDFRNKFDLCKQEPKQRTCLRCNKDFYSSFAGNRICDRCKNLMFNPEGVKYEAT